MEPTKLKWESRLHTICETIDKCTPERINYNLEKINLKIDKIIDEILKSPPTLTKLKTLFEKINHRYPPPNSIVHYHLCFKICVSINLRQLNLIQTPMYLVPAFKVESEEEKTDNLLSCFNARNALIDAFENPIVCDNIKSKIQDSEAQFWKCLAAKKTSNQEEIFFNLCRKLLITIDKVTRNESSGLYPAVIDFLIGIINHTELPVSNVLINRFLDIQGDDELWTYLLTNIKLLTIPFSIQVRDFEMIKRVCRVNETCQKNYLDYLKIKFSSFGMTYKHLRHEAIEFFEFYHRLTNNMPSTHIDKEIAGLCNNVIQVKCLDGQVFLRWYQETMLMEYANYNPKKFTQNQLRFIVKYLFSPQYSEINSLTFSIGELEHYCKLLDIAEPFVPTAEISSSEKPLDLEEIYVNACNG